jgi:hypothetical protein
MYVILAVVSDDSCIEGGIETTNESTVASIYNTAEPNSMMNSTFLRQIAYRQQAHEHEKNSNQKRNQTEKFIKSITVMAGSD